MNRRKYMVTIEKALVRGKKTPEAAVGLLHQTRASGQFVLPTDATRSPTTSTLQNPRDSQGRMLMCTVALDRSKVAEGCSKYHTGESARWQT